MDKNNDHYTGLVMDIRDCLTVVQGLVQISNEKRKVDSLHVIMENLNIADKKLKKLLTTRNQPSVMKQTDFLDNHPSV